MINIATFCCVSVILDASFLDAVNVFYHFLLLLSLYRLLAEKKEVVAPWLLVEKTLISIAVVS